MVITRFTLIRALVVWLWFVAVVTGVGGALAAYYSADELGGAGQTLVAIIGAVAAATPFIAIIAFLNLTSEIAQGVTWITGFLHDQEAGAEEA